MSTKINKGHSKRSGLRVTLINFVGISCPAFGVAADLLLGQDVQGVAGIVHHIAFLDHLGLVVPGLYAGVSLLKSV